MRDKDFQQLLQGVHELGKALKGSKKPIAKVDRIDPESVVAVRAQLKLSQAKFAQILGISIDTLQNWEQGRRHPTGPARVLLRIAKQHPQIVLQAAS